MRKKNFPYVSNYEKIDFYNKYTEPSFQLLLKKMQDKYFYLGLNFIKIFFAIGLIGMFITPWIAFAFLPGFVFPLITMHISNKKHKKAVESLSEKISFEHFLNMVETGEWHEIATLASQSKLLPLKKPYASPSSNSNPIKIERNQRDIEKDDSLSF